MSDDDDGDFEDGFVGGYSINRDWEDEPGTRPTAGGSHDSMKGCVSCFGVLLVVFLLGTLAWNAMFR